MGKSGEEVGGQRQDHDPGLGVGLAGRHYASGDGGSEVGRDGVDANSMATGSWGCWVETGLVVRCGVGAGSVFYRQLGCVPVAQGAEVPWPVWLRVTLLSRTTSVVMQQRENEGARDESGCAERRRGRGRGHEVCASWIPGPGWARRALLLALSSLKLRF